MTTSGDMKDPSMTTTQTSEPEQPFDPEAASRIQARLDVYDQAISDGWTEEAALELAGYQAPDDLREVLRQRAYARDEARLLAEKCARVHGQYEEQHERADHLQRLADERAKTIIELGDRLREAGVEE